MAMLSKQIRARMMAAMKQHKIVEKEILRVVLGEISTIESRSGDAMGDEAVQKILRKLVKSNSETMAVTTDQAQVAVLKEENAILDTLLPQTLSVAEIVKALAPVADAIKAAAADGPATGIAMKALKGSGASVGGKDVAEAVRSLRS